MATEFTSKNDIVEQLLEMNKKTFSRELNKEVENLKSEFYKLDRELFEVALNKFIEEGGEKDDFESSLDPLNNKFKEAFAEHKARKEAFNVALSKEYKANKASKQILISELKELSQKDEINKEVFDALKDLQERWNAITVLDPVDSKELWGEYNYLRDVFYSNVKINRELRELDFEKNLEAKKEIIEKTIALASEESIQKMNEALQFFHEEWKAIGPVKSEISDEIWEQFSEASKICHKKRQDYYDKMYAQEAKNLELKEALIISIGEIADQECKSVSDWNKLTDKLLAKQAEWKEIGFSGKASNNEVWEKYRSICDEFFNKKSVFFKEVNKERAERKKRKQELIKNVADIRESEDWAKTTKVIIDIQKKWKGIGDTGRHNENKLWQEFRAHCDYFFDRKKTFFDQRGSQEEANLKLKESLLQEIESFEVKGEKADVLNALKEFNLKWNSIGHVPFKSKDVLIKKFKACMDRHYGALKMEAQERAMEEFKARISSDGSENSTDTINQEKKKLKNQLRAIKETLESIEANMVLISKSKGADLFRMEVEKNKAIEEKKMAAIKEKLSMIAELESKAK